MKLSEHQRSGLFFDLGQRSLRFQSKMFDVGLYTQVSDSGHHDPLVSIFCIGNCCTNLVDLNINCTPVTNSGALSLCGGFSADRPGCTSLVKLNIMYTMIDEIGASHILESIPGLKYLGFQVCATEVLYSEQMNSWGLENILTLRSFRGN